MIFSRKKRLKIYFAITAILCFCLYGLSSSVGGGGEQHVGGSKQLVKARSTYLPARVYRVYVGMDEDANLMNSFPDPPKRQQNVEGRVLPMAIQFDLKNGVINDGRDMSPAHQLPHRPYLPPPPPPPRPPNLYFSLVSPQEPHPPLLMRPTSHQEWMLEASLRREARKRVRARNHESFLKLYTGGTLSPQEKALYSRNVPPMPQEPPPPGSYHWQTLQKQNKKAPPHYYIEQNSDPFVKESITNLQDVLDSNDNHILKNNHESHIKNAEMKAKASQTSIVWPGMDLFSQSINSQQNGGGQDLYLSKQIPLIPPKPIDVTLGRKVPLITGSYSDRHHATFPLYLARKEQKIEGNRWRDESLVADQNKIDLVTQNTFQSQRHIELESKTKLAAMYTSPQYEKVPDLLQHIDVRSKPSHSTNSPTKTVFNFKSFSSLYNGLDQKDRGQADVNSIATNKMQNNPVEDDLEQHHELEVPDTLRRDTLKANRTEEVLFKPKNSLFKNNMLKNSKFIKLMKGSKSQLDLPRNINKEIDQAGRPLVPKPGAYW